MPSRVSRLRFGWPAVHNRLRLILALQLVVAASCTNWTRHELSTAPAPEDQRVRVTMADGRRVHVAHLRVVGDSLVGERIEEYDQNGPRFAVARADVREVETGTVAAGRSALLVVFSLLAIVTLGIATQLQSL